MQIQRLPALVVWLATLCFVALPSGGVVLAQTCEGFESPDVIVGSLFGLTRWGTDGTSTAFSVGTYSCNIGTCGLAWEANTSAHPVIGQNLFRLKEGRLEQLGQSWLKHGFFALSLELCNTGCQETDGRSLGVNCADPYSSLGNGTQNGLGPKYEVNASDGTFPFPATDIRTTGDVLYKRMRADNNDLNPALNPGALYFVEGQYVTADDAQAGNGGNNASYREVFVSENNGEYDINFGAPDTVSGVPAIYAWREVDPSVVVRQGQVRDDGWFVLAAQATNLGSGFWGYEYAVQNLNSHRSGRAFRVPIPLGATVSGIGFHDVDYHSGEPFDGTDWNAAVVDDGTNPAYIRWNTDTFTANPNANALRWGTLYNFRFVIDVPPDPAYQDVTVELFRPGTEAEIEVPLLTPLVCDADGVCEPGEDCSNCAADCMDEEVCCGDGVCDGGETPCSCSADCGSCSDPCNVDADCDDGDYCTGVETCAGGFCVAGTNPCVSGLCDEATDSCLECLLDENCDDGVFCNGAESCDEGSCAAGSEPCPGQTCDETLGRCADCFVDADCDDGVYCNGLERCSGEACTAGDPACGEEFCVEETQECLTCTISCGDGQFCNGEEVCQGDVCSLGVAPCPNQYCDEDSDLCVSTPQLAPVRGQPLVGLDAAALARFEAGRDAFRTDLDPAMGLGPAYNATSCNTCHNSLSDGIPGAATPGVTRFGLEDAGAFDPLEELGGTLWQSASIQPSCAEQIPAQSNIEVQLRSAPLFGLGLVEAIPDAAIQALASTPPAGISGEVQLVRTYETPDVDRVGRFGWKAQQATLLSTAALEARDQLGLTNRMVGSESAPNGDAGALAQCDSVADPEDTVVVGGKDFVDRLTDYQRYLAPPPQTPPTGTNGEVQFFTVGCADCHTPAFTTPDDDPLEPALRAQTVRAYSDFLVHDMGVAGDPIVAGVADAGEVRTAPLWGLLTRPVLWHDGRVDDTDFEQRVRTAIQWHDVAGSEAAAAAQTFFSRPAAVQDSIIEFLRGLGRPQLDLNSDGVVDADDLAAFSACLDLGGPFDPDHSCAVGDVDQDSDVDFDDYKALLVATASPFGGAVPATLSEGTPLQLDKAADGRVVATWGGSCASGDSDYAIYEGNLGAYTSHRSLMCSTAGAQSVEWAPLPTSTYYLVVPTNGIAEGSYGFDSAGTPRSAALGGEACYPKYATGCF